MSDCGVAIVGAGPYGLAAAAHLREAGMDTHVLGRPMDFWRDQMPGGMFLRSAWEASSIGDPNGRLTLDAYRDECAPGLSAPIPIGDFLRYADWFRARAVPDIDERRVRRLERTESGFRLALDDGDELTARRVVVAAGLASFVLRPPEFDAIPPTLATHSSEHTDFAQFAGKRVLVTGGGQSALESAALLSEAGADVEVLVRAPLVHWLPAQKLTGQLAPIRRYLYRPLIHRVLYAPTDVGPPGLNWMVAVPRVFRKFPRTLQTPIARRCIRPAGASWLPARLEQVEILTQRAVVAAAPEDDRLRVTLDDGSERVVDHALLATGFRVDVRGYDFLSEKLADALALAAGGYPVLRPGFESSVEGLHFVGAPSAWSFGPIMRFVCGTRFTGRELARVVPRLAPTDRGAGRSRRTVDALGPA